MTLRSAVKRRKVFESSLTNAISPTVSGMLTVDKAFVLLGKIAFSIHKNKKYPISLEDIVEIIRLYCKEYGGIVDSQSFVSGMVKARILSVCGDQNSYKFCNNNYLAYFIASEICDNRDVETAKWCLECACFGINANILMFITYKTNDLALLDIILNESIEIARGWEEYRFDMEEISYLNKLKSSDFKFSNPNQSEKSVNSQNDLEKDKTEVSNGTVDIISIYEYDEADIGKLENQVVRAISLLAIISRCLPNFEHRMKRGQKEIIVKALEFLSDFEWIDIAKETHCLELLEVLKRADKVDEFISRAIEIKESTRLPVVKLALSMSAHQLLMRGKLSKGQIQRLESKFFPKESHSRVLLQRKKYKKSK